MDVKIAVELNTAPATGKLEFPFGLPCGSSVDLILHRSAASAEGSACEKDFLLSYAYINGKRVPVARRQRNASISHAITVQAPRVRGQIACLLKPCSNNKKPTTASSINSKVTDTITVACDPAAYKILSAMPVEAPKHLQVNSDNATHHDTKARAKAPIIDTVTAAEEQYGRSGRQRGSRQNAAGHEEQTAAATGPLKCHLAEKNETWERSFPVGPRWIFKCVACEGDFDDEQKFKAHVNYKATDIETALKPTERYAYICSKCYNQAASKWEAVQHWEGHPGEDKTADGDDRQSVDIIVMLRRDAKLAPYVCSATLLFQCAQCLQGFDTQNELESHAQQMQCAPASSEKSNTVNIKQEVLSNDGAGEALDNMAEPNTTETVVELVECKLDEIAHKCNICKKECSSKQRLQSHQWTHTTNKPFGCEVCSCSFVQQSQLVAHGYKHTGDWPYKCAQCSQGFVKRDQLTAHLKRSHTKASFTCPICLNTYLHECNLEQHMTRKHPESVPYHCTVCKKAFFNEDLYVKHESMCTEQCGENDSKQDQHGLSCTYCTTFFSTYKELCEHIAIHPEATVFKCDICGKTSLHSGVHQQHVLSHGKTADGSRPSLKPVYSCVYCDRSFKSRKGIQAHMNFHTNTHPYGCDQCGASLSCMSNLKAHMISIHGKPGDDAKCPHCPKVFKLKRSLNIHINTMHRQKFEHHCKLCNRKLASERKLQKHVALVHMNDAEGLKDGDDNPFPLLKLQRCGQCPFQTFSYTRMVRHRVGHSGIYPHQCSECSKQFVFKDQLTRHTRMVHRKGKLTCPHCPRFFLADHLYQQHIEVHRTEQGHGCTVCGHYYESQAGLEHHSQSHVQNLPFECDVCKKRFKFSQGLSVHRRFHHQGLRKGLSFGDHTWSHSCSTCHTRFKYHSSLAAHRLNKHSDSPKLACSYCGKTFNSQCILSLHIRTHTGEKPHACEHCGKAFRISTNLKNHVVTQHTKEFKMFCPLCNKGVVSNVKLKQHLMQSHKAVSGRKSAKVEKVVEEQMLDITAPLTHVIVEDPGTLLSQMIM